MASAAPSSDAPDLGFHKGLPILSESAMIQKGNRVVSQTMGVVHFDVEPGGTLDMSMRLVQTKERFDNVFSKDDPNQLVGFDRVLIFDALGAVPDERTGTATSLDRMMAKVADRIEREKAEKSGQFRMHGIEPVPEDEPADVGPGSEETGLRDQVDEALADVSEIRPGVADDEGAGDADA